jgi:IclR family transcriptional regulator, acetate operon repressor
MDVKSAGRALELFELFAREQSPMTLTEISRALDAPLSSCYALARSLSTRGYLYAVGDSKQVYPTRKLFDAARAIVDAEPQVADLEADLLTLRDDTQETVILGRLQNDKVIFLIVAESPQRVRVIAKVGDRELLHATSLGKALLCGLPLKSRLKLIERLELTPLTPQTVTDKEQLKAELEASAERGYAQTSGEYIADASSIAVPLHIGGELCAVCIVGPAQRLERNFDRQLQHLTHFARKAQQGSPAPITKWLS